jgi:hypothetical protein
MTSHSIFARQWWTVCLQTKRPFKSDIAGEAKIRKLIEVIAANIGGGILKGTRTLKEGLSVPSVESNESDEGSTKSWITMPLLYSEKVYFPLAEQNLENGPFEAESDNYRDYPRRMTDGKRTLFMYPLLCAAVSIEDQLDYCVLGSPYYFLLRDLLPPLRGGREFSSYFGVSVKQTFAELQKTAPANGSLKVSSGRMIIKGIQHLGTAVFYGDNVIESSLYVELAHRAESGGDITLTPKDCRLKRSFTQEVGGDRRQFCCWFDEHGNFRFTPGKRPISTTEKFIELLGQLLDWKLLQPVYTLAPVMARASAEE